MTTFRSEETLVGLIALILVPLIAMRILRGVRDGRLPVYRTYITRDENVAKFNALLALHLGSFALVSGIAMDLLFGLELKEAL